MKLWSHFAYLLVAMSLWLSPTAFSAKTASNPSLSWCVRALANQADMDSFELQYLGPDILKRLGKSPPQYAPFDDFITALPPVQTTELPQGAERDANIGADFLIGKLVAGRVYLHGIPYQENKFAAYLGRVVAVTGKKGRRNDFDKDKVIIYQLTVRTPKNKTVVTDLVPGCITSGKRTTYPYYIHVLKDPRRFDLPEADAETRALLSELPNGKFEPEQSGDAWQEGQSAAEAYQKFLDVTSRGGWHRGVPATAMTSPQALEQFMEGKIIAFPEFVHTSGGAVAVSVSTDTFDEESTLHVVSGQVVNATVTKNNVGAFNTEAFLMRPQGGTARVSLYYPNRIYWRGADVENPFALTVSEQELTRNINLESAFIFQKAEGPTTYGSATIINAYAAGSFGALAAVRRIHGRIVQELKGRGAKIVQDSMPRIQDDLAPLVGKLALIVDIKGRSRERANVIPEIGKIVRIEITHSTRMTRSDEISVRYLTVTLQTPQGVKDFYLEYDMGTPMESFTAFEAP